mmetsp:Transcript_26335/g.55498  ORF Transcript_26335/g.55498 Transcript_26335/m.55498 type:complete len:108 (+) Transcript_26335:1733-2056(+)
MASFILDSPETSQLFTAKVASLHSFSRSASIDTVITIVVAGDRSDNASLKEQGSIDDRNFNFRLRSVDDDEELEVVKKDGVAMPADSCAFFPREDLKGVVTMLITPD